MENTHRTVGPVTGATTAAAALTTVIFWVLTAVWGVEVPGEVQGAVTVILVVIAGYLVPPKKDESSSDSAELQNELAATETRLDEALDEAMLRMDQIEAELPLD